MARQREALTDDAPTLSLRVRQDREAEYLVIYNDNPVPCYIRIGSPEIPDERNYDYVAPPNFIYPLPVGAREFGLRLGAVGVNPGLITGTTTVEAIWDEAQPPSGGVPIQAASLSVSDTAGLNSYNAPAYVGGTFDLLLWGGLQVFVSPDPTSGQGVVQIEVSSDLVTWRVYGTWALWPNVPVVVAAQRVARYARVLLNTTAIVGEPAISGRYAIRRSLSEVQEVSFAPNSNAISRAINVPPLGTQSIIICTIGLRAIGLRFQATAGSVGEMVWSTGPNAVLAGPWGLVAYREQTVVGFFNSIFRTVGNLDAFTKIDILNLSGSVTLTGTLSVTIQQEPDQTQYLQSIFHAIGDPQQPVQVNQNLYAALLDLQGKTTTVQNLLNTIIGHVDGLEATATAIQTNTSKSIAASGTISGVTPCPAIGFVNTGVDMVVGTYMSRLYMYYTCTGNIASLGFRLSFVVGNAGAPIATVTQAITSKVPEGFIEIDLSGPRGSGGLVGAGANRVWIYTEGAPITVAWTVVMGQP